MRHPKETIYRVMLMVEDGKGRKAIAETCKIPVQLVDYYRQKFIKHTIKFNKKAIQSLSSLGQLSLPF